jgi:hypothetical protein
MPMISTANVYLVWFLTYGPKCIFHTFGDLDLNLESFKAIILHLTYLAIAEMIIKNICATTCLALEKLVPNH